MAIKKNTFSQKQLQVAEDIRRILSALIEKGVLIDPELMDIPITISEVRVTKDLKYATVYVIPLGGQNMDIIVKALIRNQKHLRYELGQRLKARNIPELLFKPDTSFDYSLSIENLLNDPKVQQDLAKKDE
jgi:ribosome-binding factor A